MDISEENELNLEEATPVTQLHSMGCGAACVAFAAGVSYRRAVSLLGTQKARETGFTLREMVDALAVFGLKYKVHHADGKFQDDARAPGTIVFVRRSPRYPFGHYLARSNNRWMDPWINLPTDGRIATARSGYRSRLPSSAQWLLVPEPARTHNHRSSRKGVSPERSDPTVQSRANA